MKFSTENHLDVKFCNTYFYGYVNTRYRNICLLVQVPIGINLEVEFQVRLTKNCKKFTISFYESDNFNASMDIYIYFVILNICALGWLKWLKSYQPK